jgi:hypothetical protein
VLVSLRAAGDLLDGRSVAALNFMIEQPQPPDAPPRREGVPDVIDTPPPDIPVVPPPDIPPAEPPDSPQPQRDIPGPR